MLRLPEREHVADLVAHVGIDASDGDKAFGSGRGEVEMETQPGEGDLVGSENTGMAGSEDGGFDRLGKWICC